MTLEFLLATFDLETWQQLSGAERYPALLHAPCLLLDGSLTPEEVRSLMAAYESAIGWLHQSFLKR